VEGLFSTSDEQVQNNASMVVTRVFIVRRRHRCSVGIGKKENSENECEGEAYAAYEIIRDDDWHVWDTCSSHLNAHSPLYDNSWTII